MKSFGVVSICGSILVGCALGPNDFAQTPFLPSSYGVNVASVIHSAKCEIAQEVEKIRRISDYGKYYPFLDNWYAEATFTLETEHFFDANGDPSFVVPFSNFSLTGSGGLSASRRSRTTSTIVVPFKLDENTKYCTAEEIAELNKINRAKKLNSEITLISGVIGLKKWINEAHDSLSAINVDPKTLGYTAEFEIIHKASAGATFTPLDAFEDKFSGKLGLSGKRKVVHKIDISTARIDKSKVLVAEKGINQAEEEVSRIRLYNAIQNRPIGE